jgi:OFA family oxalate/formate antiporter-like MFS transporter
MLTAWGFGGVFGPMLIARLRESTGRYDQALFVIAAVMLVATVIPMLVGAPTPPAPKIPAREAAA